MRALLCWEASEVGSWNPDLAAGLRAHGVGVVEVHDLAGLDAADPTGFDVCLPRFRIRAADMRCLDEVLVGSGVPMVNSREARRRCEDKGLACQAFDELGIPQPPWLVLSDEGRCDRPASWTGETIIKPLSGSQGVGIEILPSLDAALARGAQRGQELLVQRMLWPVRSWRVIVGTTSGLTDPYWRRPADQADRVLSISTGARIVREPLPSEGRAIAARMLEAVGGDLLAVDLLEAEDGFYALEINHNFDAHGGTAPAVDAFVREIAIKATARGFHAAGADTLGAVQSG